MPSGDVQSTFYDEPPTNEANPSHGMGKWRARAYSAGWTWRCQESSRFVREVEKRANTFKGRTTDQPIHSSTALARQLKLICKINWRHSWNHSK